MHFVTTCTMSVVSASYGLVFRASSYDEELVARLFTWSIEIGCVLMNKSPRLTEKCVLKNSATPLNKLIVRLGWISKALKYGIRIRFQMLPTPWKSWSFGGFCWERHPCCNQCSQLGRFFFWHSADSVFSFIPRLGIKVAYELAWLWLIFVCRSVYINLDPQKKFLLN